MSAKENLMYYGLGVMAVMMLMALGMSGRAMGAEPSEVVKGSNAFGVEMYGWLAGKEKGNLFFSPASIETALAMTSAGARGETAKQMEKTLHVPGGEQAQQQFAAWLEQLNHPAMVEEYQEMKGEMKPVNVAAYQLVIANALWGQKGYPFKREFTDLVAKDLPGALSAVDFGQEPAARETINGWIAKQTQDRIKDMVPERALAPDTRLVLTNAIYFKSNWASEFSKTATKDGAFLAAEGKSVNVPMMRKEAHFGYMETEDLQALEILYKGEALSMVILLPRKPDGIGALEKSLTADGIEKVVAGLKPAQVDVTMPRWKFTTGVLKLSEPLKGMGMRDAFEATKADFSGMTAEEPLFISEVLHKAFVAVDEEGTEAAAATAVVMRAGSARMPEQAKVFKADHPFVFLIRHRASGGILFMGRVAVPGEGG